MKKPMALSNALHFQPAKTVSPDDLYADRDPATFMAHFVLHLARMDVEGLHSKSAIASELAYRDAELERLQADLIAQAAENAKLTTVPMKYRRMEFNAQLQTENNALTAEMMALRTSHAALVADLTDAAATLRRYETLHLAKGTDDSTAKAEVNAALAGRFEATLTKAQP